MAILTFFFLGITLVIVLFWDKINWALILFYITVYKTAKQEIIKPM